MRVERQDRPGGRSQAASHVINGVNHTVQRPADTARDLDPFSWGVLADAYNIGARLWWLKRARDFENAKPLPGEFHGNATREQLSARWQWCDQVAKACRAKAEMVGIDEELEAVLRSVA